jgi:hypothetical protein
MPQESIPEAGGGSKKEDISSWLKRRLEHFPRLPTSSTASASHESSVEEKLAGLSVHGGTTTTV